MKKKLFILLLSLIMIFTLAACDNSEVPDGTPDNTENGEKIDARDIVDNALKQAEELDSFSVEAVQHYLNAYGIEFSDLEPDWDWSLASKYSSYADDPAGGYGHAVIKFNLTDGELTDEQINDYYATVFAATAAVSDDGHNIIGYEFAGEGEDALAETTLEDALDGWMQGWGFRRDGKCMVVYVSSDYDNDKESELDRLFYYNAVQFDIGVGLQKNFDDTWDEMEDYFEDNEDAIKDALEDYAN